MSRKKEIDEKDISLINIILTQGDIQNNELAEKIDLTPGPTHKRWKTLKDKGYILETQTKIDLEKFGLGFQAMISFEIAKEQAQTLYSVLASSNSIKSVFVFKIENTFSSVKRIMAIGVASSEEEFIQVFSDMFANIDVPFSYQMYPIDKIVKENLGVKIL